MITYIVVFELHIIPIRKVNFRYKTKYTNFHKFNNIFNNYYQNLLQALQELTTSEALDSWIEDLQNIINFVMSISLKRKKITRDQDLKWYTDELKKHRSKLNAQYKRMRRNPENEQYQVTYKKERARYKLAIKSAKSKSWQNFCQETTANYGTIFKLVDGWHG